MKEILPQELWFAEFPFEEDESKTKERPVIVLAVDNVTCKVLSMKVTSTAPYSEFEITLFDWNKVPLHNKSTAVVSAVRSIKKSDFRCKIERLSDDDWDNVTDLYYRFLKSMGVLLDG